MFFDWELNWVIKTMKIILINKCSECPHYFVGVIKDRICNLTKNELICNEPIPDWCPLEDK